MINNGRSYGLKVLFAHYTNHTFMEYRLEPYRLDYDNRVRFPTSENYFLNFFFHFI